MDALKGTIRDKARTTARLGTPRDYITLGVCDGVHGGLRWPAVNGRSKINKDVGRELTGAQRQKSSAEL